MKQSNMFVWSGLVILNLIAASSQQLCDSPPPVIKDTKIVAETYDFVIVGGGSGGSVLANRLTEVPHWNVLLLEAGGDGLCMTDVPLASPVWSLSDLNWGYKTVPTEDVCHVTVDDRCPWPRGKVLGGTSVINFLVYTRGNPEDYNEWERLGNPGWGYRDVLPYFIKLERTETPSLQSPLRGRDGYLSVSHAPFRTALSTAFVAAGPAMGYDINDPNAEKQLGFSHVEATMKNGRRFNAAKAYLLPVRKRKNLHVAKQARVTRILIDPVTKTTIGVEFVKNRRRHVVRATKEVLLSAGTLNSPQLLMLSGVGPRSHLEELNIPVVKDAPSVGENLQDHVGFGGLIFHVNDSVSLSESYFRRNWLNITLDYMLRGRGPLTLPGGAEALAFLNTRSESIDRDEFGHGDEVPDIELVLGPGAPSGTLSSIALRAAGIKPSVADTVFSGVSRGYIIAPIVLKPNSRGRVQLQSKNPYQPPLLYTGYYTDQSDMRTMVRGIRAAIRVSQSPGLQRFGSVLHDVPFPACAHLDFGSDSYWMCAARQMTTNLHHQSGTCKMGPREDPTSVVDPSLKVIGIEGLRVVDASIMPTLPAAHTNGPVFMIAEKASDMIKATWLSR